MRYRVHLQAVAEATAMAYVEADSLEEVYEKAEKLDRSDIDWDIDGVDNETIEVTSVHEKPPRERRPQPRSGSGGRVVSIARPSEEVLMHLTGATREHARATREPHAYEPTDPYKGCGKCGQGPGAYQHNPCAKAEDFTS
jgi:hypothetical protein